jgi:ankyrin repeat protein
MRQGRRGGTGRRGAERRGATALLVCAIGWVLSAVVWAAPDERLIDAVKRGDQAAVDSLLKQGVDVNGRQGDGATALHWAAHQDDRSMVERLLRAGADVQAANELGVTPLLLACTNGSTPVVEALLAVGADPNATAQGRETPLMVASWTGTADVVRRLLDACADVNAKEASRQQTALMWAASERHPAIVRLLTEYGADLHARTAVTAPNRKPGMRGSALAFAARVGDVESTRLLLNAGANVDDTVDEGLSALGFATVRGHVPVALLLLERGANANAADGGYSPLHWAAGSWETTLTTADFTILRDGNDEWNVLPGLRAGKLELVKALLKHGADPNLRMKTAPPRAGATKNPQLPELAGATPFFLAAMAGDAAVMQALLDAGADPALTTAVRSTPLMAAAGAGRNLGETSLKQAPLLEAARLAVKTGADVNAADEMGNTALHYAAYLRVDSVVQFLVENGARMDVRNKFGETPLWLSELALQFFGGGTYQVLQSSTGDLLRKLGAPAIRPAYDRSRPRDWPDLALQ